MRLKFLILLLFTLILNHLAFGQGPKINTNAIKDPPDIKVFQDPLDYECGPELFKVIQPNNFVYIKMTMNKAEAEVVTYSEETLFSEDGIWITGEVPQAFSDRFANENCDPGPLCIPFQPFADSKRDSLTVSVSLQGEVIIENHTQGGESTFQGRCAKGGIVYGYVDDTIVTISLKLGGTKPKL